MAFVKLFPPETRDAWPVAEVIRQLEEEFAVVDADPDKGEDLVADMIAAILGFSDEMPGKQERLSRLRSAQHAAVYVSFGDDLGTMAGCCVMPDTELFFGYPDEVDGPARPLVERAASALGYTVYEG